ncbi:acyl-CoA thioesterase [Brevibacterium sp. Marseille-P9724]|uniref:acyl-CoA thioesterase n=1 Tax=Brevibacterium sp. Marseille-P9724 TaxID=2614125 RepID=UPI00125FB7A8|nr:thioesterase family protein [Brevibacterium sp. Marseille-P9724]
MTHPLDEAIRFTVIRSDDSGGVLRAATHPAYNNMVGPFGGITAAQLLAAVQQHPAAQGGAAAQTLNYTLPVEYGEFDIHLELVRTNKSNQHWNVRITQGESTPVTGSVVFTSERDTFAHQEARLPQVPGPEECEAAPPVNDLRWLDNYEFRFARGAYELGREHGDSESVYWLRHAPSRHWDAVALASAADSFFPRIFLRTGKPHPAATISLTTYFLGTPEDYASAGEYLLCQGRAQRFGGGTADQSARLFSSAGNLLVSTHQLTYFRG